MGHLCRGKRGHLRGALATASISLTLVLCVAATGCGRSPDRGGDVSPPPAPATSQQPSTPGAPPPQTVTATLKPAGTGVLIADAREPSTLAVQVSRAVFVSAPVVVVASADDDTGIATATDMAAARGVPLLLVGVAATSLSAEAVAEITRLRPRTVLAVGSGTATAVGAIDGVTVTTDAATLPEVTRPVATSSRSVLTRAPAAQKERAAVAPVAATAAAVISGAAAISVRGGDLRADSAAITALAAQKPKQVIAIGSGFGSSERLAARVSLATTGVQLPGGGQVLFPGHRLVALYGHPATAGLGVLGEQGLQASIDRAKKTARSYDSLSSVPVVPTFEIIATTAQASPGADGDYSGESSVASLRPWVTKAQAAGLYVVLDLQPGRADFLDQAKLYEPLLRMPNVGLALDPEWRLGPGQVPLGQIGGVDASEINSVTRWLAELTAKEKVPQKLLVLHQFRLSMIRNESRLDTSHDEVQLLIHMDGQGSPELKESTWRAVVAAAPRGVPFGWKNFYDEDSPTLSPRQTMAKRPEPDMISYQ